MNLKTDFFSHLIYFPHFICVHMCSMLFAFRVICITQLGMISLYFHLFIHLCDTALSMCLCLWHFFLSVQLKSLGYWPP